GEVDLVREVEVVDEAAGRRGDRAGGGVEVEVQKEGVLHRGVDLHDEVRVAARHRHLGEGVAVGVDHVGDLEAADLPLDLAGAPAGLEVEAAGGEAGEGEGYGES